MKHLRKLLSTEEFFRGFLVIIAAVSLLLVFTAVESTAGPVDKVSTGKVPVIFSYRPAAGASSVYLAGTFNNWSPTATAMSDEDGDGIYEIRLKLEPGNYQYKFVVDGQWYEDPYSVDYAPDGYGGKNSVLVVPGGVEELVVGIKSKGGEQGVAGEKAAAPTAGLHFTDKLFRDLQKKGVQTEFVTLHVGLGTFLSVKTDNIQEHKMHSEYFTLDEAVAERLNQAKREGRRIIAVGTTSVRVLESCSDSEGSLAGSQTILQAYEEAKAEHFRFYSFGDAMLIT